MDPQKVHKKLKNILVYCVCVWYKQTEKNGHIVYIKTLLPFTTFTAIDLFNWLLLFTKISKCYTRSPNNTATYAFHFMLKQYINIKHANLEATL